MFSSTWIQNIVSSICRCVCGGLEIGINCFHGDVGIVRFTNEECGVFESSWFWKSAKRSLCIYPKTELNDHEMSLT